MTPHSTLVGDNPPTTERTLTVRFGGGTERLGPLAMGQANMVRCVLRDEPVQINIHDVWPVPAGVTVDSAIDALRVLVERHESLRTTFPGADSLTDLGCQAVAAEGEFVLIVRDHDILPPQPSAYAEAVARDARVDRFHLDRDFPLRITLLTVRGVPAYVCLVANHAAADGGALTILREEWLTLVSGGDLPVVKALAPLDLALDELSPAGRRKSVASLRYWEQVIRTGPQAMFAEPRVRPGDHPQAQLTLRSRQAGRALAAAASRTGSPAPTVLLAAWCTLVGHRAGQSTCVIAAPTSNRHRPALARAVTALSQDALLRLDVSGPTFDTVLRRAWGAALDAYRHSRFDSVRLWDMIERTTRDRGSHFSRDVVFNDVSSVLGTRLDDPPTHAEEPDMELVWGPEQKLPTRMLTFVHAMEPALRLALWADPHLFERHEAEEFLVGLVLLLEAVAVDDVPLKSLTDVTGVRPVPRDANWLHIDGCWVSPEAIAAVLRAVADTVHVAVEPAGPEGVPGSKGEIIAFVASGGDPMLTPERVHAALMDARPARPEVLAPHWYVIVPTPPSTPGDTDAWRRLPVLIEGNGRNTADAT
ncbi:condensation domain-containing protein [Streptomyces sp. NBC_00726]|uniref:condensation domain-containing protein n=1 Tax=Streptomyces sp. NBC_00726 TaxID=2903674 RepID=UPI0038653CBD